MGKVHLDRAKRAKVLMRQEVQFPRDPKRWRWHPSPSKGVMACNARSLD